jgi:DNA-binding SARP family transcriptional activator
LELLRALAAFGGDKVPADRLCDAVWPDADGDAARRSLDTSLSRLRQLLRHEDAIEAQAGKVSLNRHLVRLDLRSFANRLSALAREAPGSPAWASTAEKALALYRRPLLAGESESAWLLAERDHWRRRWKTLVRQLVDHYRAAGQADSARRVIESALIVDPLCAEGGDDLARSRED